jgi:hypothetical protein
VEVRRIAYEKLKPPDFFEKVKTEQDARKWIWRAPYSFGS